jgi:hypothetical protein
MSRGCVTTPVRKFVDPTFAPEGQLLSARHFNASCDLACLHPRVCLERKPGEGTAFSPEGASEPSPGFTLGTVLLDSYGWRIKWVGYDLRKNHAFDPPSVLGLKGRQKAFLTFLSPLQGSIGGECLPRVNPGLGSLGPLGRKTVAGPPARVRLIHSKRFSAALRSTAPPGQKPAWKQPGSTNLKKGVGSSKRKTGCR